MNLVGGSTGLVAGKSSALDIVAATFDGACRLRPP